MSSLLVQRKSVGVRDKTCRRISECTSTGFDTDLIAVGGGPCCGDLGATGLRVPRAPTTDPCNRYLFLLCSVPVPREWGLIVRGLRQAATLRFELLLESGAIRVFEKEITSPFFRFPDGNVTWHLTWMQDHCGPIICDPQQQPATSPDIDSIDSALLYTPPFIEGVFPYITLNGGVPAGNAIGDFGAIRDIRFPWNNTCWTESELIRGPGKVVLWASVRQTDPASREPLVLTPDQFASLRPEDQFIQAFPADPLVPGSGVRFGRVAGSIIYEMLPCCAQAEDCDVPGF